MLNAKFGDPAHDVTVVVGASAASTCKIQVDGETVYTMKTDAANNFMRVRFRIFLSTGACELSVAPVADGHHYIELVITSLFQDFGNFRSR